jgi:transposase
MFLARGITQDEAKRYMQAAKDKAAYRRWQTIWLFASGTNIKEIPAITQVSLVTTYKTIHRFNAGGPEAMNTKKRGGRTWGKVSLEQETALLNELVDDSTKGLIVTAKTIKQKAEKDWQVSVSTCYIYDLMKRHDWRKIVPRPTHPKADKEAQEEFKKNPKDHTKNYQII